MNNDIKNKIQEVKDLNNDTIKKITNYKKKGLFDFTPNVFDYIFFSVISFGIGYFSYDLVQEVKVLIEILQQTT